MIAYLSVQQLLELHRIQHQRFGGAVGVRDAAALEAAAARPRRTFGGEDLHPQVVDKAAALMHSLVRNHPFQDGNKRVGAHACLLFLIVNDFEPLFSPAELTMVTLSVAQGSLEVEALAIWLRQRCRPRQV